MQAQWVITGYVKDAETNEPVPFATIVAGNAEESTITEFDGSYRLALSKPYPLIRIEAIGYLPAEVTLLKKYKQTHDVRLQPTVYDMQEITVKPKRYTNKNNPAVELIQLVVDNREKNRVPSLPTYQDQQYEKIVIGFGNIPTRFTKNRFFRKIRYIWENVDPKKIDSIDIVPVFVQEHIHDFYSKNPPPEQEKLTRATKSVRFRGFVDDNGIDRTLTYLNQAIDIYEPNILLLTNKFPSPISNTAPLLYRYYPVDTLEENGQKIVKLEFYPRNKYDMYLQGSLYIALDSTYPVTRVEFTINPQANLNWVKNVMVEQRYKKHETGHYMLHQEDIRMYFGIVNRVMGIYSGRFVEHRHIRINEPLPEDPKIRNAAGLDSVLTSNTLAEDQVYWDSLRIPLTPPEAKAYTNMDSLVNSRWFKTMTQMARLFAGGYFDIAPGVELGPIYSFVTLNDIEDVRLRLSGRTRYTLSDRWQIAGQANYGIKDKRWKFGAYFALALGNSTFNRFPVNRITASFLESLTLPGQNQNINNSLGTSITRGPNDRLLYSRFSKLAYEREFLNQFSFDVGFEQESLEPAGPLKFETANSIPAPLTIQALRSFVLLRYAPGETMVQGGSGGRTRVAYKLIGQLRYAHAFGDIPGGDYTYDEISLAVQKFTNLPPFGYNTTILEGGAILGRTAYPFLILHRANQSYFYDNSTYNMMNFMEFISDRYVALTINQHFNGFFLNKVPLINRLQLREIISFKILYGSVSSANQDIQAPGHLLFPTQQDGTPITYTLENKPYMEASIGITNILKVIRIDLIRRFTHLNHPLAPKYAIKGSFAIEF